MILTGSRRQLQVKKHYTIPLVLHTKLFPQKNQFDQELDDDENISSEEETSFTREVTKVIEKTPHKKKRRRA